MITRDVLNYAGDKIGQMQFPDGTSEQMIAERLSEFSKPPKSSEEAQTEYLQATVIERQVIAAGIMQKVKIRNISAGVNAIQSMWVHHKLRALPVHFMGVDFTLDIMNMIVSGDLETACLALMFCEADDMTQPYHWLNRERIDTIVEDIKAVLGW